MYTIKEISGWYHVHPNTMSKKLVELGIITHAPGRGRKPRLEFRTLKPVFERLGYPKHLTLTDGTQMRLFQ